MVHITKIDDIGLSLIKSFEGLSLKPYLCPANVPTIGWGSTYYLNGTKVSMSDPEITEAQATQMLLGNLTHYEQGVDSFTVDSISQNQFSALVSLAYNIGLNNLKTSTLLKRVNSNPCDPSIPKEFLRWNHSNGEVVAGLTRRRVAEAELYAKS